MEYNKPRPTNPYIASASTVGPTDHPHHHSLNSSGQRDVLTLFSLPRANQTPNKPEKLPFRSPGTAVSNPATQPGQGGLLARRPAHRGGFATPDPPLDVGLRRPQNGRWLRGERQNGSALGAGSTGCFHEQGFVGLDESVWNTLFRASGEAVSKARRVPSEQPAFR